MNFLPKKVLCAIEAVVDISLGPSSALTCAQLTLRQKTAKRYLERILQELVRADILSGQRGPSGGYCLARERRKISLGEIFRSLEQVKKPTPAKQTPAPSFLRQEIINPFCAKASYEMLAALDKITIEDITIEAQKNAKLKTPKTSVSDFNI